MNTPTIWPRNAPPPPTDDALHETALDFAHADYQWRLLREDQANWVLPDRQRTLAQVFLRYHSAKLALEDLTRAA